MFKGNNNKRGFMSIFLVISGLIIFLEIILIILLISDLEVVIKACEFSFDKDDKELFALRKLDVDIKIMILSKMLFLNINIDDENIKAWKITKKHKEIEKNVFRIINNFNEFNEKHGDKIRKILKPQIKNIDVCIAVGMPDNLGIYYIVPVLSTIISMKIRRALDKYSVKKYSFDIIPRYVNRVIFKVIINMKFKIKISDFIFFILKLKSVKK